MPSLPQTTHASARSSLRWPSSSGSNAGSELRPVVPERNRLAPGRVSVGQVSVKIWGCHQLSPDLGAIRPVEHFDDGLLIEQPEVVSRQIGLKPGSQIEN